MLIYFEVLHGILTLDRRRETVRALMQETVLKAIKETK